MFESHVQQHGRVQLPQPQHVAELLQELQAALQPGKSGLPPPPTYAEVAPYSYLHSSARRTSAELLHLRRENEQLRQVQRQCEQLSAQLKESQVRLDPRYDHHVIIMLLSQVEIQRRENDLMMVTDECKKTKEQLVSYKQVMEKQQEHIEKLLTENFDLQRQLHSPP